MKNKLLAIVGTTASGKSDLAIRLAEKYGAEIVSADSRQIYRGLDLGTGKVTKEEQAHLKHHLIDSLDPNESYSLASFQTDAYRAIDEILDRGVLPILCGGTGLYTRAVIDGYQLIDVPPDEEFRRFCDGLPRENLLQMLADFGVTDPDPQYSDRHLIRMLEKLRAGYPAEDRCEPKYDVLQLAMTYEREVLLKRIEERLDLRIKAGMIEEVENLMKNGATPAFLEGLGLEYRYTYRYLAGQYGSFDEYREQLKTEINKFSKRQMTWFRKEKNVTWLDTSGDFFAEACGLVDQFLAK